MDELIEEFGVTREQVQAVLQFAAQSTEAFSSTALMLVLFVHRTLPKDRWLRHLINHHTVTEARARGWERVENGELLTLAEEAGFKVLVTTDRNLSYQQNLTSRKISIVVLGKGQWGFN